MEEIFNILSSSARIDKSKRKKKKQSTTSSSFTSQQDHQQSISSPPPSLPNNINEASKNNPKNHSITKLKQIHHEQIAAFRNRLGINLSQSNKHDPTIPDPISSFHEIVQPTTWWNDGSSSRKEEQKHNDHVFTSVKKTIVKNIENGKWINPTPIQMQSIPALLGRRDVLGCAPTGSGKSGAFIIPTLLLSSASDEFFYKNDIHDSSHDDDCDSDEKLSKKEKKKRKKQKQNNSKSSTQNRSNGGSGKIKALLLAPSRELASQLHREVERLGEGKLHGLRSALLSKNNAATICSNYDGSNKNNNGSTRGLDVLVSTPMRLLEYVQNGSSGSSGGDNGKRLDLSAVRIVVLDEADRLLDASDGFDQKNKGGKGGESNVSGSAHVKTFLAQIDTILSNVPKTAVRALFSATIGSSVRHLAESILRNEVDISTGSKSGGNSAASGVNNNISQKLTFVGKEEGKLLAIRQIISKGLSPPVIIFLQSKERAQSLYLELMYDNVNVDVIHAGKSQAARDAAVTKFRKGETWILICTDLCARGLDFKAVNMVINYDLPTSGVTYVHRIGRCGRAGRKGEAITLFTEADFEHLRNIANVMKLSGCDVPAWMLSLKSEDRKKGGFHRKNKKIPVKRKSIDTTAGFDKMKRHKRKQCIEQNRQKNP